MNIMVSLTYPLKSAVEIGKKALEALKNPLPDYINRGQIYALYGGKGIKTYTMYEIEKGREDEGIKEITQRYTAYFDVEGFEITSEVVLTIEEAMPMLGLQM